MSETITESPLFKEKALLGILMFLARSAQAVGDESSDPNAAPEAVLALAGFKNVDIVTITGTPKSTVSRRLKEAGLT